MEKLDEHLRAELKRLSPLGDPSGVVDGVLRRGARRHAKHRAGIVLLTVSVVAGSIAVVVGLSVVFRGSDREQPVTPVTSQGSITYVGDAQPVDQDQAAQGIYVARPDGSGSTLLAEIEGAVLELEWSPDGRRLAFIAHDTGGPGGLFVLEADSLQVRRIDAVSPSSSGISWSPDGSQIAYVNLVHGTNAIFVANGDGTHPRRITDESIYAATPDWSPDGTKIAFTGEPPGVEFDVWDIFVVDLATGGLTQLTDDPAFDLQPDWSPDGTKIVFRSRRDDARTEFGNEADEVYVMNSDGTGQWRLTFDSAIDQSPVWSADGTAIAFTSILEEQEKTVVAVMNADGSARRDVVTEGVGSITVAWRPPPSDEDAPSPSPSPSASESPIPGVGEDIGLGFPVCGVTSVSGEFVPGVEGMAYVATRASDTGVCPDATGAFNVVAVDFTQDGLNDASYGPLDCPFGCAVFAAPDIDGDGVDEIAVDVPTNGRAITLFMVNVRDLAIEPIEVSEPGDPDYGLGPGPLVFPWGGHVSFTGGAYCGVMEGTPPVSDNGFVVWQALFGPDARPTTVHETLFQLEEGALLLVATHDYRPPATAGLPPGGGSDLCGAPVA